MRHAAPLIKTANQMFTRGGFFWHAAPLSKTANQMFIRGEPQRFEASSTATTNCSFCHKDRNPLE